MRKQSSKPIPKTVYERFKYKLEEVSGEWAERNSTIFLIGVATGYRLQDIVDLTIGDIKRALENGEFQIQEKKQYNSWKTHIRKNPRSKKKAPEKTIKKIPKLLEKRLSKYIKDKRKSEYAFKSNKGLGSIHISAKSFSDILKKVALDDEMQLKNITGHSLRKTYASRLYDATNDLEFVRVALGHQSAEVTKRYLGLEDRVKEEASDIISRTL